MKKKSWVCTCLTQLSLCCALYVALNMGQPRNHMNHNTGLNSRPFDSYFISVCGGSTTPQQQTHLLKQIKKVVKMHNASFVVNISELGEDDPLTQNAILYFQSPKVPWYTTRALNGEGPDYFLKQIKIPYGTLDVITVNTGLLQDISNGNGNDQLQWLKSKLEASNSNWQIVVGFHPLVACDENIEQMEAKQVFKPLHDILVKYGVNMYLSGQACADSISKGITVHISNSKPIRKGLYFSPFDKSLDLNKPFNGFLLHRVSSLEIVTYFITLNGDVVHKILLKPRGREVM